MKTAGSCGVTLGRRVKVLVVATRTRRCVAHLAVTLILERAAEVDTRTALLLAIGDASLARLVRRTTTAMLVIVYVLTAHLATVSVGPRGHVDG